MSSALSDSDDSDDEFLKKKRNKGTHGRRGFSKKSSKDSTKSRPPVVLTNSTIYSSRVSKCFTSIYSASLDTANENVCGSDVEDDLLYKGLIQKEVMVSPRRSLLVVSDEEENCQNSQNTPTKQDICTIVSPSPPPPPVDSAIIGRGKRGRRGEQTENRKSLYTAVDNLTKTLSDAQHQLLDDSGVNSTLNLDVSVVDDDDVTVRMDYLGEIRRFTIRSSDPFSTIITQMSASEDVCERAIMFVHNDKTIRPTDSPDSINLHTADIIKCHIKQKFDELSNSFNDSLGNDGNDSGVIEVCLQSSELRQRHIIKAHSSKPLSIVMQDYASRVQKDLSHLQFMFDGEALQPSDTPASQDMDDGDIIDVTSVNRVGVKAADYNYSLVVIE